MLTVIVFGGKIIAFVFLFFCYLYCLFYYFCHAYELFYKNKKIVLIKN